MHKMVIKAFVGGTIRGSDQYVCGYKDVGGTKMYVVVINIYSWERVKPYSWEVPSVYTGYNDIFLFIQNVH